MTTSIRLIAFYLPQFHPIPENDVWWGRGFTEWTNVARARPQFEGHYQPHLPGELGFYDLRLPGVQQRQIELAKMHGVYGFCYHHYWFGGKKLLHRPLDQLLSDRTLDFPFCLCWANENWTRTWDGGDEEVLISQRHSPEDDLAFLRDIEPALRDPRYIRVSNRALLIVYRPALLPSAGATAERWRVYCREIGVGELFLVAAQAFDRQDPREFGFDAALEFPPNNMGIAPASAAPDVNPDFNGTLYSYRDLVQASRERSGEGYPLFRGVVPMWDNEPRRPSRGIIMADASPALYASWLDHACRWTERHLSPETQFVFVNAWNEWRREPILNRINGTGTHIYGRRPTCLQSLAALMVIALKRLIRNAPEIFRNRKNRIYTAKEVVQWRSEKDHNQCLEKRRESAQRPGRRLGASA